MSTESLPFWLKNALGRHKTALRSTDKPEDQTVQMAKPTTVRTQVVRTVLKNQRPWETGLIWVFCLFHLLKEDIENLTQISTVFPQTKNEQIPLLRWRPCHRRPQGNTPAATMIFLYCVSIKCLSGSSPTSQVRLETLLVMSWGFSKQPFCYTPIALCIDALSTGAWHFGLWPPWWLGYVCISIALLPLSLCPCLLPTGSLLYPVWALCENISKVLVRPMPHLLCSPQLYQCAKFKGLSRNQQNESHSVAI